MLGDSADELVGRTLDDITPPGWRSTTTEFLEKLQQTGQAQRYEKEYLHRDGRKIPVSLVVDFDRDEQGQIRGTYAFVTDITERKRAERALRLSEERFRTLYDEAPFGYHVIDTHGIIQSVNKTECELLGYTPEEMIGRPIFEFIRPDARDEARQAVLERIQGDSPVMSAERPYLTKDGRELILAVENRLERDENGQVVRIRSTVQDVTHRKRTEAALVASERRLRALFEGIEDAVFVHDLEGRILDANPAASRKLGYTHEEFLRLNTLDIDAPDFSVGFEDRLETQLRLGRLSCEGRHRTKDGRLIPVDISTSTIQYENQTAVLAVIRDITERKALEETRRQFAEAQMQYAREMEAKNRELTRSEARYRQMTESLLDAVIVASESGEITLFNPAAVRTFGYEASEVLGKPITVLMPESLRPHHERGFRHYLETREPRVVGRTVELRGRRKSGEEFNLELSLNAVDLAGQIQFIGSIRDLTERNQMREMVMRSEKLASIGLLSAGVAHEINNPLSYIANNLAVLERDLQGILSLVSAYESAGERLDQVAPDVAAKVKAIAEELDWAYVRDNLGRMISRTREGVQRVANIVQTLRGLARTSPTNLEPASLADLIDNALDMVHAQTKRAHIKVVVEQKGEPGPLPKIACVPAQISQVFLNLLVNAVQAIEETHRAEGNQIRITIHNHPGTQIVEIQDNGCGIDPASIPRLFDPFYTTKPVGVGTGLGLAISHGIIHGHGGRIEVEGEPGQGATFRVVLPVQRIHPHSSKTVESV